MKGRMGKMSTNKRIRIKAKKKIIWRTELKVIRGR
jgi:hypothetical protein